MAYKVVGVDEDSKFPPRVEDRLAEEFILADGDQEISGQKDFTTQPTVNGVPIGTGEPGENGAPGSPGAPGAPGAPGGPGPANTLTIGTVELGDAADAEITGTAPTQELNLVLPPGGFGTPGPPGVVGATITDTLNGGAFNLSPAYATEYTLTIIAATTLTASGMVPGSAMTVCVLQDGAGGHALTMPESWIGEADFTPNENPNEYDILVVWRSPLGTHVKRVHTGALPAGIWTPTALADQQCWYIADSLPLEDGEVVGSWDNQWPARGALAMFNNPVARQLHGVRYVEFDAALSQYAERVGGTFGTAIAQPMTIATLARVNGSGTQPVVNGGTAFVNQSPELYSKDSPRNWYANNSDANSLSDNGDWQYLVYQVNGASSKLRCNGVQAATTIGALTMPGVRLAATSGTIAYGTVDIAEVIIFKHLPSGPELASLETYLSDRIDLLNGV